MFSNTKIKKIATAAFFMVAGVPVYAEGIVDAKPYVGTSLTYDDNVFRFSDEIQAEAAFGSPKTSDTIKRTEVGLDVDLRLSRQLVSFTSNINKNRYNEFTTLNNVGKSVGLNWRWILGNKVFGSLGWSYNESITGFELLRNLSKNIRSNDTQFFDVNWQLHPDWLATAGYVSSKVDNSQDVFANIDQAEDRLYARIQYKNPRGTAIGVTVQDAKTRYTDRTVLNSPLGVIFFGDEAVSKEVIFDAAWLPTNKLRINPRLKYSQVDYNNNDFSNISPARSFDGVGKRLSIDYIPSSITAFNFVIYDEIYPIQDLTATYLRVKAFSFRPTWAPTDKLKIISKLGYSERLLLGDSGALVRLDNEFDTIKSAGLSVYYSFSRKATINLAYTGERRSSSNLVQDFDFNTLNLGFRYDFN